MSRKRRKYFIRLLIGIDQMINTLIGGDPDETLSARAWRQRDSKKRWMYLQLFIDHIFFWQDDHCFHAYQEEFERSQMSDHYKK